MSKVKDFGLAVSLKDTGKEMIRLAKLAEDLGYGTYWAAEDPCIRGTFTSMATIAAHTRKMRVGSCILTAPMRHPVSLAMEMSALDDYSEGRAVLGLGAGNKVWLQDQLGRSVKKPMSLLRESVDIFQSMIRGETVNYEGEQFKALDVKLSIPPYRPKIPTYLGTLGPKGVQFCGEKCDGLLLGGYVTMTPKSLSYYLDNLKIGAAKSGRNINDIDITYMVSVFMSDNDREERDRVKPFLLKHLLAMLRLGSVGHDSDRDLPDSFYHKLKEYADGAGDPLDLITDDIIDSHLIVGSPERCKENIAQLVDAGINSFILYDCAPYGASMDIETTMRVFQDKVMSEFL